MQQLLIPGCAPHPHDVVHGSYLRPHRQGKRGLAHTPQPERSPEKARWTFCGRACLRNDATIAEAGAGGRSALQQLEAERAVEVVAVGDGLPPPLGPRLHLLATRGGALVQHAKLCQATPQQRTAQGRRGDGGAKHEGVCGAGGRQVRESATN